MIGVSRKTLRDDPRRMLNTVQARRGMAVAPHALAAQSALAVLRDGGNAIEAMVAAAATIAVVYPHMNSIGGDAFWTIYAPGHEVLAIEACGPAVRRADRAFYRAHQCAAIPTRGPLAANTVAGTVGGWALALDISREAMGGRLPLSRLLADAIHYAEDGIPVSVSQSRITQDKRVELEKVHQDLAIFIWSMATARRRFAVQAEEPCEHAGSPRAPGPGRFLPWRIGDSDCR